jgi:hypothetical protein
MRDDELQRRVETELRWHLVRVGQGRGLAGSPFAAMQLATAQSVLRALANIGAVDQEDVRLWNARFEEEANLQPGTRQLTAEVRTVPQVQATRGHSTKKGRLPTEHSATQLLRHPLAVLAVVSPPEADLELRSIEIYRGAVVVLSTLLPGLDEKLTVWLEASLQDDLGTEYRHAMAHGRDGRWEHVFTPAIPEEATMLQLVVGKERFEIALP